MAVFAPGAPQQRPQVRPGKRRPRRWLLWLGLGLGLLALVAVAGAAIVFRRLTSDLPSVSVLDDPNSLGFKTTQIFDRTGQLLWEINDPSGGKRTIVSIHDISPDLINATLAAEDAKFYEHPGFDWQATLRAAYTDLRGEGRSGASTITQQLVRNAVLDPSEAHETTLRRKLRELVLAYQVDQRYSKDQILESYLNRVYYGDQNYGVEAAAQDYFGVSARQVDLAQAALIAGLVQSPSQYDPTRKDLPRTDDGIPVITKDRQRYVLEQMAEHNFITQDQAQAAYAEKLTVRPRTVNLRAPHWVMYIRDQLEQQFGDRTLYQAGLKVYTTLGIDYDEKMWQVLQDNKDVVQQQGGNNAALMAVDPRTGEILAFQGSLDYNDQSIDGQVNVLLSERQPGSSIKPVIYAASFLKGWAPGTSIDDQRTCWEDAPGHQWCPNNFDDTFHGQMTLRTALGNSINIPAVKTLEYVGVPAAVDLAQKMGVTTWGADSGKNLGLSLVLGGAEVRPYDMAQVYATFANNGRKVPLVALRRVVDAQGNMLLDYQVPPGDQVLDPRAAYMISNVLSDPTAKLFTYGRNTPLVLKDRPAASKTGTTDNYRDTWTDGYTPNLAIVVWVGNTDGHPMNQALSTLTAGKIWPAAMQASIDALNLRPDDFVRPQGLEEHQVCGDTAMRPGEPPCRNDLFVAGQAPPTPQPTAAPTAQPTPPPEPTAEPTQPPEPTPPPAPTQAPPPPAPVNQGQPANQVQPAQQAPAQQQPAPKPAAPTPAPTQAAPASKPQAPAPKPQTPAQPTPAAPAPPAKPAATPAAKP